MSQRTFEHRPAVRERVPLLVGLFGASGCGKTKSALRLATGMQRVTGGEIFCVDTEHRRALHYADEHTFQHVPFTAPFSPDDYLEVLRYCAGEGAGIVIVDSMSHEHEGPGGVLEWHDAELKRMGGTQKMTFAAWAKPKAARRKLINEILQLGINAIFCFRAKEKLKLVTGQDPVALGWMPIAGEEFLFEMTVNCLLLPASGGVPTWKPDHPGEKMMLKLPGQFRGIFQESQPLSEEIGEQLARWAAGDAEAPPEGALEKALMAVTAAEDVEALKRIAERNKRLAWTPQDRATLGKAINAQKRTLEGEASGDESLGDGPERNPCQGMETRPKGMVAECTDEDGHEGEHTWGDPYKPEEE